MFCKKCGNELKDGIRFCPKCGEPAPNVTPICKENAEDFGSDEVQPVNSTIEKESETEEGFPSNPYVPTDISDDTDQEAVVSIWQYLGWLVIQMIPIVGLIVMIVFAVDGSVKNRANYARAYFLAIAIKIVLFLLFYSVIIKFIMELLYSLW